MAGEDSLQERIRKRLDKEFGANIYKKDFTLGIRIPFEKVTELRETDISTLKETVEDLGLEDIKKNTVTTLLVADQDSAEFETEILIRSIESKTVDPIHEAVVSTGTQKIQRIDEKVRDLINESLDRSSTGVSGGGGSGAKIEESYKLGGRGRVVGNTKAREDVDFGDIAVVPTIRNAVRKGSFRNTGGSRGANIKREHLRENIYRSRTKLYQLMIVDNSYLPDETRKIRTVEEVAKTVLTVSYEKRSQVGMISSSGDEAKLELPFTTEVSKGEEVLNGLDYGGLSPLPSALKKGLVLLERARGSRTDVISIMMIITRGKANVPLFPGGYVRRELTELSKMIRESPVRMIIVNVGGEESNMLKEMAYTAQARYYEPPVLGENVEDARDVLQSIGSDEKEDMVEAGKQFLEDLENP
ncbi:MAG: VWA domain-containing protein [Candidatus Thermoplasmatota archaeon]|nr:VWA domain-containing protein [Candidatus Thermoplasmatota archaeon]